MNYLPSIKFVFAVIRGAIALNHVIWKPLQFSLLCISLMAAHFSYATTQESFSVDLLGQKADQELAAELPKAIRNGLSLAAPMQAMQALVTPQGLEIQSVVDNKQQFMVTPVALGKGTSLQLSDGKVMQDNNNILLQRDLLTERISSSADGIRQDFFIHQQPEGNAGLTLDLALHGVQASQQHDGVLLTLSDGRELVYNRLYITDATGAVLQGRLVALNHSQLQIQVDDQHALYPILIDPTYSDADWQVLNNDAAANSGSRVETMAVWNNELYVGGNFRIMGNTPANFIAKWNGSSWSALGSDLNGIVSALSVYNNELVAAGGFTTAGGAPASKIATWNGSRWAALGSGLNSGVNALTVYNNELIVGGYFTQAGDVAASRIAKWNGSKWSALGAGVDGFVGALTIYRDELIVGGGFYHAGGLPSGFVAKWNGSNWSVFSSALVGEGEVWLGVNALVVYNNELIAGGGFANTDLTCALIAKWNGNSWVSLGSGVSDTVYTLNVYGDELIVGGKFSYAGDAPAKHIAKWDGSSWSALGSGVNDRVFALGVYKNQLIVGGRFTTAGGKASPYIAGWPGTYTVNFDANGATQGTAPLSDAKAHNRDLILPGNSGDLVLTGYSFSGWNTTADGSGTAYAAGASYAVNAAVTLYAQWTLNNYSLTFDTAGGSAVAPITANFGSAVTAPAAPSREGYSFIGWNPAVPATMPAQNLTLTAQWVANSYTLTFDTTGGAAVAPITASFGSVVTAPAAPTREGYTFAGWSPAVPVTMPASNITLTAQWTLNNYSLTFDTAGGSAVAAITASFGSAISAPADPSRDGYTFAGWDPAIPATMPAQNLTFKAQWSANSYTLSFDTAGGSAVAPVTASFGSAVAAPVDPSREGYTFAGWSPAIPATMPAANTTLTAQWTVNSYTLTFDSAGGSSVAAITSSFGTAVAAPVAPSREGYTFAGWSPVIPTTMPAQNLILTAQWTVNSYTLTFDSAGGSAVAAITASFGSAISAPADPSREGYTFVGWTPSVPATMPAQNLTLTAQYKQIQLTVTASVTGAASITPATQLVNYGSAATLELRLTNPGDIVVLSGSCQAAVSGNQIVTATITQDCVVAVAVHPFTTVEKDTTSALASNGTSRFSFVRGAGEKTLTGASVKRSGVESELPFADANALLTRQSDGSYIFSAERTGRYSLNFIDVVSAERVQVMYDVFPYLAFTSMQQPAQQNVATTVRVWLSDEPVEYPVTATVVKEGVAEELQQVELTTEHNLQRTYGVTANASTARLTLQGTGINRALLGTPAEHTLILQPQATALALRLTALQNSAETYVIAKTAGPVALSVGERNATAATYSWTSSGLPLKTSGATASFDPSSLAEGRYTVTVTAQSADGRTGQTDLALRVIADCPVENCAGAGSSGIPAAQNSFVDTPNRLPLCPDVEQQNRVERCKAEGAGALYVEVPNQYQLTLGALSEEKSWTSGQFGGALNDVSLNDAGFVQQGLIINFDVLGLEKPGEVVPVAIPLPAGTTIPASAIWRKFINGRWQNFVVNSANRIDSAVRDAAGLCPGVSSDKWSSGLSVGHSCVRLTIEDGGPNDDDGAANSVIRDPGVLATVELVVLPPVPPEEETTTGGGLGGWVMLLLVGVVGFRIRWCRSQPCHG